MDPLFSKDPFPLLSKSTRSGKFTWLGLRVPNPNRRKNAVYTPSRRFMYNLHTQMPVYLAVNHLTI